jgi:NADH-quinone oxidoreductase subunit J
MSIIALITGSIAKARRIASIKMNFLQIVFTAGSLICATRVAQSRNPVYAVMCLVLLFLNASGLLLLQGMEFFAILQIIIYIGALSVMFLFVVMLLNIKLTEIVSYKRRTYYTVAQVVFVWAILLASQTNPLYNSGLVTSALYKGFSPNEARSGTDLSSAAHMFLGEESMPKELGVKLYLELADLLIMASLMLLVAMIGAVVLSLKKRVTSHNPAISQSQSA